MRSLISLLALGLFVLNSFAYTGFKKTEGWLETDHYGSGFHIIPDVFKPNIWIRVFKFDGAVSDVVGLPNSNIVGRSAEWGDVDLSGDAPKFLRGGDYFRLVRQVDFNQEIARPDADGNCSGGNRCFGDWVNNAPIWDDTIFSPKRKDGRSFFMLKDEIYGKMKTRYRFQIYVEENVAHWLKDKNGDYDIGTHEGEPDSTEKYYALKEVVVRIIEMDKYDPGADLSDDDQASAELYHRKSEWKSDPRPDDFRINAMDPQERFVNGRLVYNFNLFHTFRKSTNYMIVVTALDMSDNRRTLRVPISMDPVGGLNIQNKTSGGKKQ